MSSRDFQRTKRGSFPMSPEGERAIICALLTKREAVPEILSKMTFEDFTFEPHRTIFGVIGGLYARQKPIDLVTVSVEMKKLGGNGGDLPAMFKDFSGDYPIHIQTIKNLTKRRRLMAVFTEATEKLGTTGDIDEVSAEVMTKMIEVSMGAVRSPMSLDKVTMLSIKRIEEAIEKKTQVTGIPTGFADFDNQMGGVQPGELMIIGARPSIGKSALIACIAIQAARRGYPTMIVNAEMELVDVGTRLLAGATGIANFRLRRGRVEEYQIEALVKASVELSKAPVFIYDDTRWEVIKTQVRAMKAARKDLAMVLLDYVGRVKIERHKDEKRYEELGRITKEAKDLAKDLQIAFIMAAQLNRAVEREKKPPDLVDLRESGDLEQDSDIVTFLHRVKPEDPTEVLWLVRKNRNGPTGSIRLRFNPSGVKFSDWEQQEVRYDQAER